MRQDAEAHATEDAKKKELVEAKNQAESLVHLAEKTLKEAGDKAKPEDKREVEDAITSVRSAMAGTDQEKMKTETEKLSAALQKIGAAMYSSTGSEQATDQPKPEEELPKDDGSPDTNQPEEPKKES
jgi:molecular chaperone DnaK